MSIVETVREFASEAAKRILQTNGRPLLLDEAFEARLRSDLETLSRHAYIRGRADSRDSGNLERRDKFAMNALAGLCGNERLESPESMARYALACADALIAALDTEASQ